MSSAKFLRQLWWLVLLPMLGSPHWGCGDTVLREGMTIRESGSVRPGTYLFPRRDSNQSPVLTILGEGTEIDFQGTVLQGASNQLPSQSYQGVGLRVVSQGPVTLKNLIVKGFSIGIEALNCEGVYLENCDLSGNVKACVTEPTLQP